MPNRGRSCGSWEGIESASDGPRRNVLREDPVVARNIFAGNQAWEEAGGIRFCFFGGALPAPTVTDNLIIGNSATQRGGGLVIIDAAVTCTNTTIVGNECTDGHGGGVIVDADGSLILRNSIVAGNTGSGICLRPWGALVTDHCDVFGNSIVDYEDCAPSTTDISCDPEFCAPESGDYQLFETSCCQGAGAAGYDIGASGVGCFTVPDVLFYDNFSDQDDADWYVTSEGGATLEVSEGAYRGSLVTGAVAGVVASGFATGNLAYRLIVKPETTLPAGTVGLDIYLRRATQDRYYRISLSDTEGRLWKRIGFEEQALLTFSCQLVTGAWQSLYFEMIDWQLSGYLDAGNGLLELFVYEDDTLPILAGTLGVGLSGGALSERVVWFDDVLVAALDSTLTAVAADEATGQQPPPADLALRVFPNPANPTTTISFELATAGPVRVTVHALNGSLVSTLLDGVRAAGRQRLVWRGRDDAGRAVASGTYVCRIIAGAMRSTHKLVLAR